MFYELTINNDTLTIEQLEEVQKALVKIVGEDNLDEEARRFSFIINETRIILPTGIWGLEVSEENNVRELSKQFPDYVFAFTKTWEVRSVLRLDDLQNYSREEFEAGKLVRTYKAAPITWIDTSSKPDSSSWFTS